MFLRRVKRLLPKANSLKVQHLLAQISENGIGELSDELTPMTRRLAAREIIYKNRSRPNALLEQFELLLGLSQMSDLTPGMRLNAGIAATHKALELCDKSRVLLTMQNLDSLTILLEKLNSDTNMRENILHVSYSLRYVQLNAQLSVSNRQGLFLLARQLPNPLLSESPAPAFFYRTVSNLSKCAGFAACAAYCTRDIAQLELIGEQLSRACSQAFACRPKNQCSQRLRHGVSLADNELRSAAALSELILRLGKAEDDAKCLISLIGSLAIARRDDAQKKQLQSCWDSIFIQGNIT